MKRTAAAFVLLAALVACRGGGSPVTPSASTSPTPTPTASPSPTPADSPSTDPQTVALAVALEGSYSGTWTNTTFGSNGPARMTIDADPAAGIITVTVDVDGGVFGGADPGPETLAGTLGDLGIQFAATSPAFGSITATVDSGGRVIARLEDVPGDRVDRVDASGTVSSNAVVLNYTAFLADGTEAHGTFRMSRA